MRHDGRSWDQLRPVTIECGWHKTSDGSALYRAGKTVVLCTASIEDGVKDFLRGQGRGWVTAEYLMHPRAGGKRQNRDGFNGRPLSGRSHEIARLIGRALRSSVDLRKIGERTIHVDCDVLEADGGTRTAAVTGGMVALSLALDVLRRKSALAAPPLRGLVSAVSAGIVKGTRMLDLAYVEDSAAEMDLNVVASERGGIVELQATSEDAPVDRAAVDALVDLAMTGITTLTELQRTVLAQAGVELAALAVPR